MDATRLARTAAVATAVVWGVKTLAVWAAGGLDEIPLESPLSVLGLVAALTTGGASGVALDRGRPTGVRVAAAVAGVVTVVLLAGLLSALSEAVVPHSAGWAGAEAGLWVAAVLLLVLALRGVPRRAPGTAV